MAGSDDFVNNLACSRKQRPSFGPGSPRREAASWTSFVGLVVSIVIGWMFFVSRMNEAWSLGTLGVERVGMQFWKCVVVDDISLSRRLEVVVCKLVAMWGALGAVSESESGVGLRGRKGVIGYQFVILPYVLLGTVLD